MDGAIYEGDERREGRDGAERAFAGLLSADLQAVVSADEACVCVRRWDPCSEATHCDCASQAEGKRSGQTSKDRREVASQSCISLSASSIFIISFF